MEHTPTSQDAIRDASARPTYTAGVITFLALLMAGCFQPTEDLSTIDTLVVPYESPHLTDDGVSIHRFESKLTCPGGEPAEFFVVAGSETDATSPVAVVLHSGAFDYVVERSDEGPLAGPHYHAQSRLDAEFGVAKVYETLGLQISDLDPSEEPIETAPEVKLVTPDGITPEEAGPAHLVDFARPPIGQVELHHEVLLDLRYLEMVRGPDRRPVQPREAVRRIDGVVGEEAEVHLVVLGLRRCCCGAASCLLLPLPLAGVLLSGILSIVR